MRLDEPRWLSIAAVAARFDVSESTVRAIPVDELPYKEFGRGLKLKRRRYLRYGAVYGGHVTAYGQSKLRALVEELEALEPRRAA